MIGNYFLIDSSHVWSNKDQARARRGTGEAACIVYKLQLSDNQPTDGKPAMLSGGGPQMDNHP